MATDTDYLIRYVARVLATLLSGCGISRDIQRPGIENLRGVVHRQRLLSARCGLVRSCRESR